MIKVDGKVVNIEYFPDGTPRINLNPDDVEEQRYDGVNYILIKWFYEKNDELFYLMLIKKHLERHFTNVNYELFMPYIPNGRMDRIKHDDEVFTLKHFCDFINYLNFDSVFVLDAHSDVSVALLNNCSNESPKEYIEKAINHIESYEDSDLILFFPDSGASKRYSSILPEYKYVYGNKVRTWETGEIVGLEIVNPFNVDLKDKAILIVDDICSKGTTFAKSAEALSKYEVKNIYLWITHCENTIFKGEVLTKDLIKKVFTTNSIFTEECEKVEVLEL